MNKIIRLKEEEINSLKEIVKKSSFNLFSCLIIVQFDKAKQSKIDTPRNDKRFYAFDSCEYYTKRLFYGLFDRKMSIDFIKYLRCILPTYKDKTKIYAVLDNYIVHHSKKVKKFL